MTSHPVLFAEYERRNGPLFAVHPELRDVFRAEYERQRGVPTEASATTDSYDADGYNQDGYNRHGYDADGYNRHGFDYDGYNRHGYDADGYNRNGYDADGYNHDGYNRHGYDRTGCDADGYTADRFGDGESDDYGRYPYHTSYENAHNRPMPFLTAPADMPHARQHLPFFGVELETESPNGDACEQVSRDCLNTLGWTPTEDGSLGEYGVECVSPPGSLAYWQARKPQLTETFARWITDGVRSHQTSTCGLHVHVSRTGFSSPLHMIRFQAAVYGPERLTLALSRRTLASLTRWANLTEVADACGGAAKTPEQMRHVLARKLDGLSDYNRYQAVRETRDTLELRVPRGTLKVDTFLATVEYCAALVEYTRHTVDFEALLSPDGFPAYVQAHAETYPHLAAYLPERLDKVGTAGEPETIFHADGWLDGAICNCADCRAGRVRELETIRRRLESSPVFSTTTQEY